MGYLVLGIGFTVHGLRSAVVPYTLHRIPNTRYLAPDTLCLQLTLLPLAVSRLQAKLFLKRRTKRCDTGIAYRLSHFRNGQVPGFQ